MAPADPVTDEQRIAREHQKRRCCTLRRSGLASADRAAPSTAAGWPRSRNRASAEVPLQHYGVTCLRVNAATNQIFNQCLALLQARVLDDVHPRCGRVLHAFNKR